MNKTLSRPEFSYTFKFLVTEYPGYLLGDCKTDEIYIRDLFNSINLVSEAPKPESLDKHEIHQWWHYFTDCSAYPTDPY